MTRHPVQLQIKKADSAINREDFDTLIDIYSDDAVLVVKPGVNAVGKMQIRKAFEAIAAHFNHSLDVKQAGMKSSNPVTQRWSWPRRWSQLSTCRPSNGAPPMYSSSTRMVIGFASLIIPTGMSCCSITMPNPSYMDSPQSQET